MAPWEITWGSCGDCKSWSDCEIGTGAGEGSKYKHTQRKWVNIPTLVLAHCGSPRILEADAKNWSLCAFGSLCEQTNVTMTVFGWILLWPPCLKGLDAGSACLQLRLGLSLGSQYQADLHHCVLRWKREHSVSFTVRSPVGWGSLIHITRWIASVWWKQGQEPMWKWGGKRAEPCNCCYCCRLREQHVVGTGRLFWGTDGTTPISEGREGQLEIGKIGSQIGFSFLAS